MLGTVSTIIVLKKEEESETVDCVVSNCELIFKLLGK